MNTFGAIRGLILVLLATCTAARADIVTDWDEFAVSRVAVGGWGERDCALMHLAMFDAVNSIDRRYQPFLSLLPAKKGASREAAATAAAANMLRALYPAKASEIDAKLAAALSGIPEGAAKADGMTLGQEVATRLHEARKNDGVTAVGEYRPRTRPGVYVPTSSVIADTFPGLKPFALQRADQFRPAPPVTLTSVEWATDYNEIRRLGRRSGSERTEQQTETARFWLMIGSPAYHPLARQVVAAKRMDLVDSARFMALFSTASSDAYVAIFDAKYHYEFWRPLTAIRNGDLDENPATERDASWLPIEATPMHPEYPCAHCVASGAAAGIIKAVLGAEPLPELVLTSSTLPGVTHRWRDLDAFCEEVENARIWAGFHYRFSARVGTKIGKDVADYTVKHLLLPVKASKR